MNQARFSVEIATETRPVVSVSDFVIEPDTITFLFGESGIGKSMISKAIYGLIDPARLRVSVNGRNYSEYLRRSWTRNLQENSFFVFQEPSSHLNPLVRLHEQLNEGSLSKATNEEDVLRRLWQSVPAETLERILRIYPKPYRPSGGEKQRLLLAMAFKKIGLFQSSNPEDRTNFFVFDEPTGSLDNVYRNLFLELLFDTFRKSPFTAMLITHDYSIISEIFQKHNDILSRVRFKELVRAGESRVSVRDFSPDHYLNWLRKASGSRVPASSAGEVVLDVSPRFSIFGRKLGIYADHAKTRPARLTVRSGEMVYVKAPSGVGKTTLAKLIMGLYQAEEFEMKLLGKTMTHQTPPRMWPQKVWGKNAGMVFQHADEALDLEATVKETFDGLPLEKGRNRSLKTDIAELFEGEIDSSFLNKKVKLLSGGQKQRLNLLRTLVLKTGVVILDEPLNALDFGSIQRVLAILERHRNRGAALLMISHNEEIFDALVDPALVYHLAELN